MKDANFRKHYVVLKMLQRIVFFCVLYNAQYLNYRKSNKKVYYVRIYSCYFMNDKKFVIVFALYIIL